jgi:hypothetical protein
MKIIPSSKIHYYVARIGIFLVMAALIAGVVGCGPTQYNLTVSSTEGGEVTNPGEGAYIYNEGTVVNLVAEADEGYQFVNWTGDVDTIGNANAAATNITMNGQYTITANFALAGLGIWDWYDLDAIRDNLGGSYFLMNDLDSTTPGYEELVSSTANDGKGWQPIGTQSYPFTGIFDGQGYEISDLFISRADEGGVGLFFGLYYGGSIKDVGVVNATVTGDDGVGGLMGLNAGTVSNSYSSGNVTGEGWYVGGLAGLNAGDVSNSFSTGSASGGGHQVGGLLGGNDGAVDNSYSTVTVTGNWSVGGLVGANGGTVSNCYCTGSVTGSSLVGGLVGDNGLTGTVSNSFWDIETTGQGASDGGTGMNTTAMKDITTYLGVGWNIIIVTGSSAGNIAYIWNIVDDETYPFLSWQS